MALQPGQFMFIGKGDVDQKPRIVASIFRLGITDAQGNFDQALFDATVFAFGQLGWDNTVHTVPQVFMDKMIPAGGFDLKLDSILSQIDLPNSVQSIGSKVGNL